MFLEHGESKKVASCKYNPFYWSCTIYGDQWLLVESLIFCYLFAGRRIFSSWHRESMLLRKKLRTFMQRASMLRSALYMVRYGISENLPLMYEAFWRPTVLLSALSGDSLNSSLVAIVCVDPNMLKAWAVNEGIKVTPWIPLTSSTCSHEKLHRFTLLSYRERDNKDQNNIHHNISRAGYTSEPKRPFTLCNAINCVEQDGWSFPSGFFTSYIRWICQ